MATKILALFSIPMNREKGVERRFIPLFYSCNREATRAEDVVGRNAEMGVVDYNVPVAVVRENTQLCTYFFIRYTNLLITESQNET